MDLGESNKTTLKQSLFNSTSDCKSEFSLTRPQFQIMKKGNRILLARGMKPLSTQSDPNYGRKKRKFVSKN